MSVSYSLIENQGNAGLTDGVNGNIIGQDPLLDPLADNGGFSATHALQGCSPAIDAGDDTGGLNTDQRGVSRLRGSTWTWALLKLTPRSLTLPRGTTQATLSLSTNESATCRYATTAGTAYASMPFTFAATGGVTHTQLVTGLEGEHTYSYYVRCLDTAGNANDDDYVISFDVFSSDVTPPVISNVQAVNVTPYSAEITWETDEECTSQVEYGTGVGYGALTVLSSTRMISHSVFLVGLDPATAYHSVPTQSPT